MADKRIEWEFDHEKFMADVRAAVGADEPSLRDIELVTGISASTFSRVDNGKTMDMDAFMTVCAKLNLTPGNYFRRVIWQRIEDE